MLLALWCTVNANIPLLGRRFTEYLTERELESLCLHGHALTLLARACIIYSVVGI